MEISLRGSSVAGEHERASPSLVKLLRQCDTICQPQLRTQVTDHAHDVVFEAAEVEAPVSPIGKSMFFALKLGKQAIQGHTTGCENPEVAMHREDELVFRHGGCNSHGDCFLTQPAEPLADFSLPQLRHHFLLNHARKHELFIKPELL